MEKQICDCKTFSFNSEFIISQKAIIKGKIIYLSIKPLLPKDKYKILTNRHKLTGKEEYEIFLQENNIEDVNTDIYCECNSQILFTDDQFADITYLAKNTSTNIYEYMKRIGFTEPIPHATAWKDE